MTSLQIEIARCAVNDMFTKGFFSICVVDNILKLSGGIPDRNDYHSLSLLHCISFKDMPRNVRIELPRLIQKVIESPSVNCEIFRDKVITLDGTEQRRIA